MASISEITVTARTRFLWWPRFLTHICVTLGRVLPLRLNVLLINAAFSLAWFQMRLDGKGKLNTPWQWVRIPLHASLVRKNTDGNTDMDASR